MIGPGNFILFFLEKFLDDCSQVGKRRGGDVYQFFKNFPTPQSLLGLSLLNLEKKISDQDVFTPGLLNFYSF